jgi:hypothetical protein
MPDKIRNYAELRELIRFSLRAQHPEWIEPNGDSPSCDFYEARFAKLLGLTGSREDAKTSTDFTDYADCRRTRLDGR